MIVMSLKTHTQKTSLAICILTLLKGALINLNTYHETGGCRIMADLQFDGGDIRYECRDGIVMS